MKEVSDVLAFFAAQAGTLEYFALFFPGFVALAVYDLRVPGERRKFGDMGVALVAYSVLIDSLSAVYLWRFPIPKDDKTATIIVGVVADLLVPALIGWFVVDLREALAAKGWVLSAIPKAWDEFFGRLAKLPDSESVALVIKLSNGDRVGGFWAEGPFASSFPRDEDLYIPAPVLIDQESGRFIERVSNSRGLLLKRDDIMSIEAFDGAALVATAKKPDPPKPHSAHEPPTAKEPHG